MDSDFSQSLDYRRQILHYTLMPEHLHLVVGLVLRHNGYHTHHEPPSYSFDLPRPVASQLDNPAIDRLLELVEGSLGLAGGEHVIVEVEPDDEGGTLFHAVSNHPDGSVGQATFSLNDEKWFVLESSPALAPLAKAAAAAPPEQPVLPVEAEEEAEEPAEEIPGQAALPDEEVSESASEEAPAGSLASPVETYSPGAKTASPEAAPPEEPEPPAAAEVPPSEMPTMVSQATSAYNRDFATSLREEFIETLPDTDRTLIRDAQSKAAASRSQRDGMKGMNFLAVGLVAVTILAVVAGILLIWQPPFLAGPPILSPTALERQATATSVKVAAPLVAESSATPIPPTDEPTAVSLTPTPTTEPVRGLFNYIVNENDTIVGLADRWGLDPTSILLCNPETLPNALAIQVGLELRIPPEDGACIIADGERTLAEIADTYDVSPEVIINSPHNGLSGLTPDDKPAVDTLVFIPGGTGTFQERNWSSEVTINPESDLPVVDYAPDHPGSCGEIELQPKAEGTGNWVSPLYFYQRITQGYHPWHLGLDLASPPGTPIFASDRGTVVFSGWNNWGYGNLVVIDHGNGWSTFYGHLKEINYDCGEIVRQGDVVGQLGSTGNSTGPHLHFEIHKDGRSLDPQIQIDF